MWGETQSYPLLFSALFCKFLPFFWHVLKYVLKSLNTLLSSGWWPYWPLEGHWETFCLETLVEELITSFHIQGITTITGNTLRITTTNIITMANIVKIIPKKNKQGLLILGITTDTLSTNMRTRQGEEGRTGRV